MGLLKRVLISLSIWISSSVILSQFSYTIPPYTVNLNNDSGLGSFRQAILDMNADGPGLDPYDVNITGPQNVTLLSDETLLRIAVIKNSDLMIQPGFILKGGGGLTIDNITSLYNGVNTYSGGTTINATGTLNIFANYLPGDVLNNGALRFEAGSYGGVISGIGTVVVQTFGTVVLSGANLYSGGTTISVGTVQVGTATALGTGAAAFANGTTLQYGAAVTLANAMTVTGSVTVDSGAFTGGASGIISGTGGLRKTGTGALTLSGASNYSGGTTITAGTIIADNNTALGTNTLTFSDSGGNNSTLEFGGGVGSPYDLSNPITLTTDGIVNTNGNDGTLSGVITGSGTLIKNGAGVLTLSGDSSAQTWDTIINEGAISISNDDLLPLTGDLSIPAPLPTTASFVLGFGGNTQTVGLLTGGNGASIWIPNGGSFTTNSASSGVYAGVINGLGSFIKDGTGTLTLSGISYAQAWNTTINAGTVAISASNLLPQTGNLDLPAVFPATATFDMTNLNQTVGLLTGDTGGSITLGTGTLTTNSAASGSYDGVISGAGGSLVKGGTGTLTLSGANTYDGSTTINAGRLDVTGSIDSAVTVANGARLGGSGTIADNITVNAGGSIGANTATDTLLIGGDLTFGGATSVLSVEINDALNASVVSVTGNVNLAGIIEVTAVGPFPGAYPIYPAPAASYAVLNWIGAEVGDFTSVTNVTPGFYMTHTLDAAANKVFLNIQYMGGVFVRTSDSSGTNPSGPTPVTSNRTDEDLIFLQNDDGSCSWDLIGTGPGLGSVVKLGTGTVTFSGNNTYDGGTTIDRGGLVMGNAGVLGTGDITFNNTSAATTFTPTLTLGGNYTLGQDIILTTAGTINNNTYSGTASGDISGNGALIKIGGGVLTLSGVNTYSGGTVIGDGTNDDMLVISQDANLGAAGAPLTFMVADPKKAILGLTGGPISLTGDVIISGIGDAVIQSGGQIIILSGVVSGPTGTLWVSNSLCVLTGLNTHAGNGGYSTVVENGIVSIATNTSALGIGNVILANGSTLIFADNLSILNGFELDINSNNAPDLAPNTIDTGTFDATISGIIADGSGWYNNSLSGTATPHPGQLIKSGSGKLTLTGANTYSGGTIINVGILSIDDDARLGNVNGGVTFNSGTLQYTATTTSPATRTMTIGATDGTIEVVGAAVSATVAGDIIGGAVLADAPNYVLTKSGAGTLVILSDNNAQFWSMIIDAGILQLSAANRLPTTGNVTVNNAAIFNLNNFDQQIAALNDDGAGTSFVTLGAGDLTIDSASNGSYGGTISNTGQIIKKNTGTQTLSGANTYDGGTEIQGGIIEVGSSTNVSFTAGPLGTGALTFNDSGGANPTLQFAGNYTIENPIALTTNGIVNTNSNNGTLSGVILGGGSLTKDGAGTLTLSNVNGYTGATSINGGQLDITGSITSDALIMGGAGLGGTGTITGNTVVNDGGAIGATAIGDTLSIVGDLTFGGATSVLRVNIDDLGGRSVVNVTGDVGLAGIIEVTAAGTNYPATNLSPFTYKVLEWTGAVTGDFLPPVICLTPGLYITHTLNGNDVVLNVNMGGLVRTRWSANTPPGPVEVTSNQNNANLIFLQDDDGACFYDLTGTGSIVKRGEGNVTFSGNNNYSNGTIIDLGGLVMGNAGALGTGDITFNNTSAATTFMPTLTLGGNYTLGQDIILTTNGTINTNNFAGIVSGTISGNGALTKIGGGWLTLSGANTYSGGTVIGDGTNDDKIIISQDTNLGVAGSAVQFNGGPNYCALQLSGGPINTSRNVIINGNSTADIHSYGNSITLSGDVSETLGSNGTLWIWDDNLGGVCTLSGNNTHTGMAGYSTAVEAGSVVITTASALGTGTVILADGTLRFDNNLTIPNGFELDVYFYNPVNPAPNTIDTGTSDATIRGIIADGSGWYSSWYGPATPHSGQLIKIGAGTLTLTEANTYSGGTNVNAGTIQVGNDNALGTGSVTFVNGTALQFGANVTLNNNITLGSVAGDNILINSEDSSAIAHLGGLSGIISGAGTLTKNGAGTLTLSGANTYTGDTIIDAGTLQLSGGANRLPTTANVTINNTSTFDLNSQNQTIASLTSTADTFITLGSGILTFDIAATPTCSSSISGSGSIIKNGAGTLFLKGASSSSAYTGKTTINEGTLITDSNGVSDITVVTVYTQGTFQLSADKSIKGFQGDGTVDVDNNTLTTNNTLGTTNDFIGIFKSSSGGYVKDGLGKQNIQTSTDFTGHVSVVNGTLGFVGNIQEGLSVEEGGSFFGNGSITGPVIISGNIHAGPDFSLLSIQQDMTFQDGASIGVTISANGQCSLIEVSGEVSMPLSSALGIYVSPQPGIYSGNKKYVILNSQGINREAPLAVLSRSIYLQYSATINEEDDIVLTVGPQSSSSSVSEGILSNGPLFNGQPSYRNLRGYVEYLGNNTSLNFNLAALHTTVNSLSEAGKEQTYKTLDPRAYATFREINLNRNQGVGDHLLSHIRYVQLFGTNGGMNNSASFATRLRSNSLKDEFHRVMLFRLNGFDALQAYAADQKNDVKRFNSYSLSNKFSSIKKTNILFGQKSKIDSAKLSNTFSDLTPYYMEQENSSFWIEPFVQTHTKNYIKKNANAQPDSDDADHIKLKNDTMGIGLGGDHWLKSNLLMGVAFGYSTSSLKWANYNDTNNGKGGIRNFSASLYGSCLYKGLSIEGSLSGAHNTYQSTRYFTIINNGRYEAKQSHGSFSVWGDLKLGYQLQMPQHLFEPYVRVSHMVEKEASYKEENTQGLGMYVEEQTFQLLRFESGFWGSHMLDFETISIVPTYKVSWIHKKPTERAQILYAGFQGSPGRFVSDALPMARNFANPGFGLTVLFDSDVSVSLNYSAELSSTDNRHDLFVKFKWKF